MFMMVENQWFSGKEVWRNGSIFRQEGRRGMYEFVCPQRIHTPEGEEYTPRYAFCNAISTSAKTEFLCKRRYLWEVSFISSYLCRQGSIWADYMWQFERSKDSSLDHQKRFDKSLVIENCHVHGYLLIPKMVSTQKLPSSPRWLSRRLPLLMRIPELSPERHNAHLRPMTIQTRVFALSDIGFIPPVLPSTMRWSEASL